MIQTNCIRKILVISVVLIILITLCVPLIGIAYAQPLTYDDYDIVFLETTKELYETQADEIELTANKEILYDMQISPLGYIYNFTVNGEEGFAILIPINDEITVTEFSMGESPYTDIIGNKIYASYLTYLYEKDGRYYFAGSDSNLSEETLSLLSQKSFKGTGSITYSEERVTYTNKNVNKKNLAFRHPYIVEVGGLSNACAPIAGANLIQYWDRFCENLIPNYTPYTMLNNQFIYKGDAATLNEVVRTLYTDMKTNVNNAGTTEDQFKNGFKTFCNRQGYNTVTFNSCMQSGKFNYNLAKQRIEAEQPLAIFVDTFTVADISESDTDFIAYLNGNGCHVMAGFGYKEIFYTLTNGSIRNDYYIAVASGYSMYSRSFFNVNLNTIIDDVFGVVIS